MTTDTPQAQEPTEIEKLRAEFDAKYKAFEDAHRDQVKAAFRDFGAALKAHPVTHLVMAAIGAAALKLWPHVASLL